MNKEKQINKLKLFFESKNKTLMINQVNEEIALFYIGIIKHYANENKVNITEENNFEENNETDDLFGKQELMIYSSTNFNKINKIINSDKKKIILSDYKNYKKYSSTLQTINGYQYIQDLKDFIKDELKINNSDLIFFCVNNPIFLLSETSMYLVNKEKYMHDKSIIDKTNHIYEIRKSIFEIKKNKFDIKVLYSKIKEEVKYKNLSFLIY